ncbi:MAG: hypothetical protein J0M20_01385 [Burkholderiales bacterium]|nr:hypothetical protein [Burkholderiales bacterium]
MRNVIIKNGQTSDGRELQRGDIVLGLSDDDAARLTQGGGAEEFAAGKAILLTTPEKAAAFDGLVSGAWDREYPLNQYGDVQQATYFAAAASMAIASTELTVDGYVFTDADVGKTVGVKGPGYGSPTSDFSLVANDGVMVSTIQSVANGKAYLLNAANQTATGCEVVFGWPCDAAFTAAVAACTADYAADGVPGCIVIPGGRFIVTGRLPVSSGVSIRGVRREGTHVHVCKIVANADDSTTAPWFCRAGSGVRYKYVSLTQFSLIGTFFAATSGYGSDMKMIHMDTTEDSFVTRMRIKDNPSTALGYDKSLNCELAHNIIVRGGRLARPSLSGSSGGAGGSAIGVAVADYDISMHIHHNRIIGSLAAGMGNTDAGATGRSGINIEASAETPNPPAFGGNGLIIEANIIEGYYNGIVDSGSHAARIVHNIVRSCVHGIKAGSNGVTYGRVPRDTLVSHNDVSDLFAWGGQYAVGLSVNSAPGTAAAAQSGIAMAWGRTRVLDNTIRAVGGGYGIALLANSGRPLLGLTVRGNLVSDCDLSGIRLFGEFIDLELCDNTLISNGRTATAGNKAPIRFDTGTTWVGGKFSGNRYLDPEASPTQDAAPTVNNAVLTNVWAAEKVLALINGTVANLPAASATYKGVRATVSDASAAYTSANVGSTVAAGGSNQVPVFCNGSNWVIG